MTAILLSFIGIILSFIILGFQVILMRRQREIGRHIETLEERVTELEVLER